MSDETTMAAPESATQTAKKPGFLTTRTGKIVAILVGVTSLGIVLGLVFVIVMFVFGDQAAELITQEAPAASGSASTTATVEVKNPAAEIANAELFTFRDIFEPLLKPLAAEGSSSTTNTASPSGTTTDTLTPTAAGTLYLDGVVTENGVLKAQLRYNGSSYTLGAGGVIPNSPWQVLRVSSSAVTMLYGDVQVTLAVGQGITK